MAYITQVNTSTLSNQNITTALLVHTFTNTTRVRKIWINVHIDQVIGNGDYIAHITKQLSGAGSFYTSIKTTLALASGVTSGFFGSNPLIVGATDVVRVYVIGLAGDTTTPDITTNVYEEWENVDANGRVDLGAILGTALTESVAGYLAVAFKKLFDVATPVFTEASVNQSGDGFPSIATAAAYAIVNSGIAFRGAVSAVPGTDQFTIATLVGLGAGMFADATAPYRAFVLRDAGGVGAAPQGETQNVIAYNSTTGTFTTAPFTTPVGANDDMIIMHPRIAEMAAIKVKTDLIPANPAAVGSQMDLVNAPNATAITAIQSGLATLSKLLKYFQLALRKDAAIAADNATELAAINASGGSGAGAFANTTDSEEALRDRIDTLASAAPITLNSEITESHTP